MQQVFHNGKIVLDNEVIDGSIAVEDGVISSIDQGGIVPRDGIDLEGDYLTPGLVDVHSDNIEKLISPRPNVIWPSRFAAIAHDAYVVGVGVTTILDAISLSDAISLGGASGSRTQLALQIIEGITQSQKIGALRSDHFLHIRCEVTDAEISERLSRLDADRPIRMLTLLDHTPGQRVFRDVQTWRAYRKKGRGLTDGELDWMLAAEQEARARYATSNRRAIARIAHDRGIALGGHDDSTVEDIADAVALGSTASEFPTTIEAARAAQSAGLKTIMGGPNLVRGGSHIGNLSARDCAEQGALDILASDYMPVSLLQSAFMLTCEPIGYDLPRAIATVTSTPAEVCGLTDRGRIAVGKRADLLRVSLHEDLPILRAVWRSGRRVH